MTILKWLAAAAIVYMAFTALLYVAQRKLLYVPDTTRYMPATVGLPEAQEIVLDTTDGEKVVVWHVPPDAERPVVIYFQGNGGGLNLRAWRFHQLVADGTGLIAVNYRGFGGSSGSPSEDGLLRDAAAAYEFAARLYPARRIAVWGESLGTGVAVALAAECPVARVILESPFTSTADIAAAIYPFVPVRWFMKDQFHSDRRVGRITAPVLILHGTADNVVPLSYGERLYALIRAPKRFVHLANAGHNDHDEHSATQLVQAFLMEQSAGP